MFRLLKHMETHAERHPHDAPTANSAPPKTGFFLSTPLPLPLPPLLSTSPVLQCLLQFRQASLRLSAPARAKAVLSAAGSTEFPPCAPGDPAVLFRDRVEFDMTDPLSMRRRAPFLARGGSFVSASRFSPEEPITRIVYAGTFPVA
jgi:hypothetical protein